MNAARLFFIPLIMGAIMAASPIPDDNRNVWQIWLSLNGVLLNSSEKAVDFAEAVVRARFGQKEVEVERPFVAHDRGDAWEVVGTNGSFEPVGVLPAVSAVWLRKNSGEILDFRLQSSEDDTRALWERVERKLQK